MKKRYLIGEVVAKAETQEAFCCSMNWAELCASDIWIPKSVIHHEFLDNIEEAVEGDVIEIAVAEWWIAKQ